MLVAPIAFPEVTRDLARLIGPVPATLHSRQSPQGIGLFVIGRSVIPLVEIHAYPIVAEFGNIRKIIPNLSLGANFFINKLNLDRAIDMLALIGNYGIPFDRSIAAIMTGATQAIAVICLASHRIAMADVTGDGGGSWSAVAIEQATVATQLVPAIDTGNEPSRYCLTIGNRQKVFGSGIDCIVVEANLMFYMGTRDRTVAMAGSARVASKNGIPCRCDGIRPHITGIQATVTIGGVAGLAATVPADTNDSIRSIHMGCDCSAVAYAATKLVTIGGRMVGSVAIGGTECIPDMRRMGIVDWWPPSLIQ